MIQHYFTVAFRNMWKYKSQTLISVAGLAVGFACFAMATLWIRYEMTYDSFHKDADRLYRVSIQDDYNIYTDGITSSITAPLAQYMKKTFPEISDATKIVQRRYNIEIDDVTSGIDMILTDSSFFKIFDVRVIEGNMDFLIPENKQIAITQNKAIQLSGKDNPVGKTVKINGQTYTIGAIVNGFPKHSNYAFDVLGVYEHSAGNIVVRIAPGVDMESFSKKLHEHKTTVRYQFVYKGEYRTGNKNIDKIILSQLTSIHYKDPHVSSTVKFQHLVIFAVAGSLLILCTLFNYLTLFVSRFRIRMREFALRIVFGASNRSLFALLSVEFLMSLVTALLAGIFLIQAIIPYFIKLSGINIESSFIYIESLIYIGIVILISLLTFLLVLYMLRGKALNIALRRNNRKMFRKTSVVVQLIISTGFAFCTVIILKQIYYLHNTDLGFSMKNCGHISLHTDAAVLENELRQIPEIEKTLAGFPSMIGNFYISEVTYKRNDSPVNSEPVNMRPASISEELAEFYEIKLVAGEMLSPNDPEEYVLINESAAEIFGWKDPTGKTLISSENTACIIKGVIKNIYSFSPTSPVLATVYMYEDKEEGNSILFKYRDGTWETCKNKIMQLVKEKYPELDSKISINNDATKYSAFLKSENALLAILTVISFVCMTVCVFGFVSIVSLTCEERRKEIAIRKINGATIKDILDIFFKEHLTLLVIGSIIAFPVGYVVMKRWLEQYVVQTEMSAWIYLSILLALFMAIVLCVGGRVYKTSRENPIKAINN
jgi:ABC-type antimicrobial peptide transport system permease subunit